MIVRIRYLLLALLIVLGGLARAADDQAAVLKVVAEQLKAAPSTVGLDTPLSAVGKGADALDIVEIMMAIERTLHVDISDKDVESVIGPNETEELPAKTTVRNLTQMVSIGRRK